MNKLAIFGGESLISVGWPRWPYAGERERELVDEVLSSDIWGGTGLGPKITELNKKFAEYCDAKYGAAVANGTVSMELCLVAWGIGPGDEVIIPAATFMATAVAVHNVGATVVYVDVDPKTLNIDNAKVADAITNRTKAIIPVHIGGHPCDIDPLIEIAGKHNIKVLEDAAQAHGAIYKGRKVGSLADVASFSFQQSKNLQSGEGGIVVSDNKDLIDLIHYSLGKFGRGIREKYSGHIHYRFGWNACYTEIQAAIALAQLERLEEQTEKRTVNAKKLYSLMENIEGIETFEWQPYCDRHAHHLFLLRFKSENFENVKRAQFLAALNKEGVLASSFYPMALYNQPLYKSETSLSMRKTICPVAEQACREVVFIEQNLLLADSHKIELIAEAVKKIRKNAAQLHTIEIEESEFIGSSVLKKAAKKNS
ncbi:MAG: DegT/DnrJ/EryC1/StrS family aminotransferase [Bacteroidetes bacterium]|nr:DegT/DnrJ/EryC1/StrS family aminotransferase [Bacteroidota bacterium]